VYKVEYLPEAIDEMLKIENYLYEHSPAAADRFAETLEERTDSLAQHPLMCQVYDKDPFFRRMVIGDYLLFYSVDERRELVVIHHIFHHSQDTFRLMPAR